MRENPCPSANFFLREKLASRASLKNFKEFFKRACAGQPLNQKHSLCRCNLVLFVYNIVPSGNPVLFNCLAYKFVRGWWNWQTRQFEGLLGQPLQVQVLSRAPFYLVKIRWPHRLAWPRMLGSQPKDWGSNPHGATNIKKTTLLLT